LGVVKSRYGEMTVPLPLFQKNRWDQIIKSSLPDPPAAVIQTEQLKFQAYYVDEEVLYHVRFFTEDTGEEHLVSLLPQWENQVYKVRQAFGREMIPDTSRQSKDNIIYVKAADGSSPDPTFERLMKYTLGEGLEEFSVRIHKVQTTRDVMTGLKSLHAGINPSKIIFEGSEMADEDPVTDWATETGTSPLKVNIKLDQPVQRFQLWQCAGMYDLGAEDLDGRSKEEIWVSLKRKSPLLKRLEDYKLYVDQDEVSWNNLPVLNVTLVPNEIPVISRGMEFKIADRHKTNKLRQVGPLTPMTYQIFMIDKAPIGEPVDIIAPNEISLAQLITHFVLPSGIDLDAGSVFYRNLREEEPAPGENKTKRKIEQIQMKIPPGFNLRVKCSSLREASRKKMAHVKFGIVRMNFAMAPNDTMGRLKERVADWMNQLGQGPDWTIDRPDREEIEFEYEFEVVPLVREVPVRIFLKQEELQVLPSLSWINLSDQLVAKWNLPKGSMLRILPVIGTVNDQDEEDHSHTITWEEDRKYWYDIIYDPIKDTNSESKEIVMVDPSDRTDTLVVPANADVFQVRDLWKRLLEVPHDMEMNVQTANNHEYYWNLVSARKEVAFTLRTTNFHGNAQILEGSPHFVADQLSRVLELKTPPLTLCQQRLRQRHGPEIQFDGEVPTLNHRLLKEHRLVWNLEGTLVRAPQVSTWWVPYNRLAIMKYGNSVNCAIPADPNEAEFPDEPWPLDVTIMIKSHSVPQPPASPLPAGDPLQAAPRSLPPGSWLGPLPGQAPRSAQQPPDLLDTHR
jgi:hypothetical protein